MNLNRPGKVLFIFVHHSTMSSPPSSVTDNGNYDNWNEVYLLCSVSNLLVITSCGASIASSPIFSFPSLLCFPFAIGAWTVNASYNIGVLGSVTVLPLDSAYSIAVATGLITYVDPVLSCIHVTVHKIGTRTSKEESLRAHINLLIPHLRCSHSCNRQEVDIRFNYPCVIS